MNVDENWRALTRTDALPVEAIEASLQNWDAVSDRYLGKLRAHASGAQMSEDDENALFIVVHMFAEKRDARAFAPLCKELSDDLETVAWLGDAVTETLAAILVSVYDGDPEALQGVFEAPNADSAARNAALMALGYLTRAGNAMSDEAMRAYLRRIGQTLTDAEDPLVGLAWAQVIAALGYDDLGPEVARAMSRGAIDADLYGIKEFHADLRAARDDPEGLAVFRHDGVEPLASTVEALSRWDWGASADELGFDTGDERGPDLAEEFSYDPAPPPDLPIVNPLRHVGRNDPCPCGSGKKYKKCCLAA
jgi:hypothetical protein